MTDIKLLRLENGMQQNLCVTCFYTDCLVIHDRKGRGFTVKQCATVIHEDNAANKASAVSLMIKMKAVTHAFRSYASRSEKQTIRLEPGFIFRSGKTNAGYFLFPTEHVP